MVSVKPNEETEYYEKSSSGWKPTHGDPDTYVSWNHGEAYVKMEDSERANAAKGTLDGTAYVLFEPMSCMIRTDK